MKLYCVYFGNKKDSMYEYFEAENKAEALDKAELWIQDEASGFAYKKDYKILRVLEQ